MDGYQFLAEVIKALAWPAALVWALWYFHERIADLLPRLKLKYKGLDISFPLAAAEKEAENLPQPEPAAQPTPEETSKFQQLAKISPASAVADKSREIEQTLAEFSKAVGMRDNRFRGWLAWTRELRKAELIDSTTAALLDDLRAIRNIAVHGGERELTESEALRFGALADKLIYSLQVATGAALNMAAPAPLDNLAP